MFLNRYNDFKKLQQGKKKKRAFINNCAPDHFQQTNVGSYEGNTESFRGGVQ